MTPKTNTLDLADLSDDALARETLTATRLVNIGGRDPHFGRPTRETGHRRLALVRQALAEKSDALAREVTRQLATAEGNVTTDSLTRCVAIHALAAPEHPAWARLAEEIDAPVPRYEADPWSMNTDAEHAAEVAERTRLLDEARVRLADLTAEAERRRQVAEDAIEVERIERYRAKSGV